MFISMTKIPSLSRTFTSLTSEETRSDVGFGLSSLNLPHACGFQFILALCILHPASLPDSPLCGFPVPLASYSKTTAYPKILFNQLPQLRKVEFRGCRWEPGTIIKELLAFFPLWISEFLWTSESLVIPISPCFKKSFCSAHIMPVSPLYMLSMWGADGLFL